MQPRIKHRFLCAGIKSLQTMLLQRLHQDGLRHLQPFIEALEFRSSAILPRQRLRRHRRQRTVEVIDALDQIGGEARNGKVARGLDFSSGALLQVAEVGDGAEVSVLIRVIDGEAG